MPWWSMVPETDRGGLFAQVAASLPAKRVATADDLAQVLVLLATNPNPTATRRLYPKVASA